MDNDKIAPTASAQAPAPAYSEFPEAHTPTPVAPQNTYSPHPASPLAQSTVPEAFTPQPGAAAANPSGYTMAVPLASLQRGPTPVDCPVCGQREMTRTEPEAGNTTHGWAAVLCCCFCLGCLPYLMSSLKDVNHFCGKCGAMLATWHNSGRVEVHTAAARKAS
ncbi:uncharacterized protein ACLA_013280 [Aspergillus clavatus NRRL 1]|uniref:LITAF domain-containing protein n=1 Tax=Aspergillus clavatus (strain ATCC 1007 / CBS 513.65 / DSM 816 / NCTC 3887 / NRRL 1 / QM 1276 / 107) TaxID=344612 RepID=A1CAX5_ASPCL|nr:uncharacterized protein ACLA_013280 [Aspergillus clavatus NRRL 1]EAW12893.1 conserved hypothetical protein [Aspergillus clavatus NRRL 1]